MFAETLSALGRVHRVGHVAAQQVEALLRHVMSFPVVLDPVGPLLAGAWSRRDTHALPDALYVELAARLGTVVITTDQRLGRATPLAEAPPG
jgi:predicted nucleic acid-binding protein